MNVREEKLGDVIVLEAEGRVDSTTAPVLGETLTATLGAGPKGLVLDLRLLEYISSAGLRTLLQAAKRAEELGSRFVLCGISGKVRQLFDLGGFLDLFTTYTSKEEGVASIQ
ncbi:MAG: STAS domain-containing protein [Thermoplasmata archaeon]